MAEGNVEDCMHVGQCRGLLWQRGNAEDCCGRGAMQRIAVAEGQCRGLLHVAEGNAASRNGTHAQVAKSQAKV